MDLHVGIYCIMSMTSDDDHIERHIFGRIIFQTYYWKGTDYSKFTLDKCIVHNINTGEVYNVSEPITLLLNDFRKIKIVGDIDKMVSSLLYALNITAPNVLESKTVDQIVSTVYDEMTPKEFQHPTKTAIDFYGNPEFEEEEEDDESEEEEDDDNNHGGSKKKRRSKKHKKSKRSTIKKK